ncbi:MAG: tRNA-intron lyase [Promethearchaeota archaeon]|nr:MAG: tRNA-intron lyase [Candidatus Lokiarchaeota archaeon]
MTEDSNEKKEKLQFEGIIRGNKVLVNSEEAIEEFYEGSYIGTLEQNSNAQRVLLLDPLEVLLLSERRRIILRKNNKKTEEGLEFEELISYFSQYDDNVWQKYIIYMDLRKRGYIVRKGYGEGVDFLVYPRGANFQDDTARYLIFPVFEGTPVELRDLDKMSRVAMSSRKDLIIATVDRLSKPIYYSVNKFQIMNKEEQK